MNRNIFAFLTLALSIFTMQFSTAQCAIWEVSAVPGDCDGNFFNVALDFEYGGVGNEGFTVLGNGNDYGDFEYADLPVSIGPLEGDGTTVYEFVILDNQNSDCNNWTDIDPVNCGAGDCEIYDLVLEASDCDPDGNYDLHIDFQVNNPTHTHFDVIFQGSNIGYFALADLPVVIENFEDQGFQYPAVSVCINDNGDCCAIAEFEAPNCGGDCEIWDVEAVASDCIDGEFYVTLSFEYENVGNDGFNVVGNGQNYGHFDYGSLPIDIGPLVGDGTTFYEFVVIDAQHPDCSDFIDFGTVDCNGGGDCQINDLVVEVGDCNPDGTFHLWIDFNVQNQTDDFFDVIYNGEIIGNFEIDELPVHFENFEDNGEPYQGIAVCLSNDPNCCEDIEFEAPNCGGNDCHIFEVFAEAHPCDDEGQFMVDIEFESQNTGNEGFWIQANGVDFGPFEYGEPFYTFGPLDGGTLYELVVQDNQFPDCHGFYLFGPVFCDDDCHIYNLEAETTECDDEGQFFVLLDFEFANVGNDGFSVIGNGNNYGFFGYDDLPVEIGPFPTPIDDLEFIVSDVQQPDCADFVEVEAPNCDGGGDCHIFGLVADLTPCFDDGTFFVVLDFEFENTSDIGFSVHGNGINYGLFSYDDVPLSIGPLVGNGTTPYEFAVHDLLFEDCGDAVEVGPVDCGATGDCEIFNLVADAGSCHDDGTYNLWINFQYTNVDNMFFEVFYDGELVDYFPLANLPVVIPHFQDNGNIEQEITVCINDNPNCCASTVYEAPDCNGPNLVWPGDGNADNIANHFDLLHIGLAYEAEGEPRATQGLEWTGLEAENWDQEFITGLNYAHADCDGDGIVSEIDMEAIQLNFGETHGDVSPPILIGGTEADPSFYVDLPEGSLQDGEQFFAPIILGNEDVPVDDLYGIAFTLNYDPAMVDPASIQLQYDPSWLGVDDVNLLTFDRTFADLGVVHVAIVRTDQSDVSGHGQIAAFIGIIDNIAGKESMSVEITDVKAIQEDEVLIPLYRPVYEVALTTGTQEPIQGVFEVYPNPAKTEIYLQHPEGLQVLSVEVKSVSGVTLKVNDSQNNTLNVSDLAAGVYLLKIETEEGFFLEKLVKI